jgi:hypothetical protein
MLQRVNKHQRKRLKNALISSRLSALQKYEEATMQMLAHYDDKTKLELAKVISILQKIDGGGIPSFFISIPAHKRLMDVVGDIALTCNVRYTFDIFDYPEHIYKDRRVLVKVDPSVPAVVFLPQHSKDRKYARVATANQAPLHGDDILAMIDSKLSPYALHLSRDTNAILREWLQTLSRHGLLHNHEKIENDIINAVVVDFLVYRDNWQQSMVNAILENFLLKHSGFYIPNK